MQDDTSLPVLPNKTVLILLSKKMLSRLSCTSADGTKSSSSATEEDKQSNHLRSVSLRNLMSKLSQL